MGTRAKQFEGVWSGLLDVNGDPISGGKVYTYEAGTTTDKTTYTDATKTILASNPIILDAFGRGEIYGDGLYRIVVKDANDNTLWDMDDIELISSEGGSINNTIIGDVIPAAGTFTDLTWTSTFTLGNQNIDAGVAAGDCIYWDTGTWKKALLNSTPRPQGIYQGNNKVVFTGGIATSVSGLAANSDYYLQTDGSLSTKVTDVYIGTAKSLTEIYVNIDVDIDEKVESKTQTINGGMSNGEAAYYDQSVPEWNTANSLTTEKPFGILLRNNDIVHYGKTDGFSGLTPGSHYYLNSSGAITTTVTNVYVGFAMSATVMFINFKVMNNFGIYPDYYYWGEDYSTDYVSGGNFDLGGENHYRNFTLSAGHTLSIPNDRGFCCIRATQSITLAGIIDGKARSLYDGGDEAFDDRATPANNINAQVGGNGFYVSSGGGGGSTWDEPVGTGDELQYNGADGGRILDYDVNILGGLGGVIPAFGSGDGYDGTAGAQLPTNLRQLFMAKSQIFFGASGGGGGSYNSLGTGVDGGKGGRGGAGLKLCAPKIILIFGYSIDLSADNGVNGDSSGSTQGGAGGGGGGGGGALCAGYIEITGGPITANVSKGTGGIGGTGINWDGGDGGDGADGFVFTKQYGT